MMDFTAHLTGQKVLCYGMVFVLTGNRKYNKVQCNYLYEATSETGCLVMLPGKEIKYKDGIEKEIEK